MNSVSQNSRESEAEDIALPELQRRVREKWPRLTENDLRALDRQALDGGNYEGLVGRLRERYALDETTAQNEARLFLRSQNAS